MKFVSLCALVALAGGAFSQGIVKHPQKRTPVWAPTSERLPDVVVDPDSPIKVPDGVTVRECWVRIGADGVGRASLTPPDRGVRGQDADAPDLPVYEAIDTTQASGSFTTAVRRDGIPFAGICQVNSMDFWYYDNTGTAADTCKVDITFYDGTVTSGVGSAVDAAESRNGSCTDAATSPVSLAFTVTGLPRDAAFSWIVHVDLTGLGGLLAQGRTWIGYVYYYEPSGAASTSTGPILMNYDTQGVPLGAPVTNMGGNYIYRHSPGASNNTHFNPAGAGTCNLFANGTPAATHGLAFYGRYATAGQLRGNYGTLGPLQQFGWFEVTDGTNTSLFEVKLFNDADTGENGFFTIPLNIAGIFDVRFVPQNGYLGRKVSVSNDLATTDGFDLVAGDVTGDNLIDVFDLNGVLINFSKIGD